MACIVVIYDGSDPAEAAAFEKICTAKNPETGSSCKKLSPTAFWLNSLNVNEMKVAQLTREISRGHWYCLRLEDDEFTAYAAKLAAL